MYQCKVPEIDRRQAPAVRIEAGDAAGIVEAVGFDLLQFHGDEPAAECERTGVPYVKAVRVGADTDLEAVADAYASAVALLLDTPHESLWGGSGQTFDWSLVPAGVDMPIVLAGGLTPANVAEAIAATCPTGVDAASGVEGPRKGEKDEQKLKQFVQEVRRV